MRPLCKPEGFRQSVLVAQVLLYPLPSGAGWTEGYVVRHGARTPRPRSALTFLCLVCTEKAEPCDHSGSPAGGVGLGQWEEPGGDWRVGGEKRSSHNLQFFPFLESALPEAATLCDHGAQQVASPTRLQASRALVRPLFPIVAGLRVFPPALAHPLKATPAPEAVPS